MTSFKKTVAAVALAAALPLGGCDSFLDVNDDPNTATEAPDGLLMTSAFLQYGTQRAIEIGPNANFNAQYWASSGSAGVFLNPERYSISAFTTGNWFRTLYTEYLSNLQLLIDQAETDEIPRPSAAAQAKIAQGMAFIDATVVWGDVPFTEALNVDPETGTTQPIYDDQVTVLRNVVDLMDEALGQLDQTPNFRVTSGDVIYNGDLSQWRKFANSIKLRALVLLRAAGQDVDGEIDALIAGQDMIESNEDNALIPFDGASPNSLNRLLTRFAGGNNVFLAAASTSVDLMNDLEDPRRPIYIDPRANGTFEGAIPGTDAYGSGDFVRVEFLLNVDSPERLMTADQVLLLQAEYLADKGRLDEADDKYRAGIQASLDYFGITDTDYIDSLPALGEDDDDGADAVDQVQQQLYIAMFGRGIEGWTLARRGDPEAGSDDGGFIDRVVPLEALYNGLINRYPYPVQETTTNPNVPSVAGTDLLNKMAFQTPGSNR